MRWFSLVLLSTILLSCSKDKEEFVKLRISNQTNYRFSNVSSNGMNFGDVRKKSKSHYLKLKEIRNYPDIKFHLGQQPFESHDYQFNYYELNTYNYVGKYTVEVDSVNPDSTYYEAVLVREDT